MTELSFAKQFLTALDSRPLKLSSDHIADPRSYPASNAYTLPRLPAGHPTKPARKTASSSTSGLSVQLKPLKPSQQTITLSSQAPSTSVYDLKAAYAAQTGTDISKIKVLHKKKPVPDTKVLSELTDGGSSDEALEFGIMILGGAAAGGATPVTTPPVEVPQPVLPETAEGETPVGAVAQGSSGAAELRTEEFWGDLKGFLVQRLRDEEEGERWAGVFREVWQKEDGAR